MIQVELVVTNPDGSVRSRWPCGHKHRSLKAAKACARNYAKGVPASGGEKLSVVYQDGNALLQVRVLTNVQTRGRISTWKTLPVFVAPSSNLWLKGIAATESV